MREKEMEFGEEKREREETDRYMGKKYLRIQSMLLSSIIGGPWCYVNWEDTVNGKQVQRK